MNVMKSCGVLWAGVLNLDCDVLGASLSNRVLYFSSLVRKLVRRWGFFRFVFNLRGGNESNLTFSSVNFKRKQFQKAMLFLR